MPALFGDHMVLQQESKLPIWGSADPGENVTVALGRNTGKATADAAGQWRVDLAPVPGGTTPQILTVTGKNTLTFQDVLIGDVWLATGQSNMQYGISNTGDQDAISKADEPEIRLFCIPRRIALTPQDNIPPVPEKLPLAGKWQICTPDTVRQDGDWGGFSAVAYYFAHEIHQATKHPLGVIMCPWGGTPIQPWISLATYQKDSKFQHYADDLARYSENFAKVEAAYPQQLADYPAQEAKWKEEVFPVYQAALDDWQKASGEAKAAGQPLPSKPNPSRPEPHAPDDPAVMQVPNTPTVVYNGLIAPLIPYALKGVLWYQGESNSRDADQYQTLLTTMILDWREKWGLGDFPFLIVQLANYEGSNPGENWAQVREAQLKTLALPQTGMAVTVDIGNPKDVHPRDKRDVGLRLALVARHVAYGEHLIYSGPIYQSMQLKGGSIEIAFTNIGDGLKIGVPPASFKSPQPAPEAELTGFTVAGDDQAWKPAKAEIQGDKVIVSSEEVSQPTAVRYGWANTPECNLYNSADLPASPFRTDDWKP